MLCHEVGLYPINIGDSLKGFRRESDISNPALCFKMFPLVASVEYGLLKEENVGGRTRTRREVTRKSPWAQWKEMPNSSS